MDRPSNWKANTGSWQSTRTRPWFPGVGSGRRVRKDRTGTWEALPTESKNFNVGTKSITCRRVGKGIGEAHGSGVSTAGSFSGKMDSFQSSMARAIGS